MAGTEKGVFANGLATVIGIHKSGSPSVARHTKIKLCTVRGNDRSYQVGYIYLVTDSNFSRKSERRSVAFFNYRLLLGGPLKISYAAAVYIVASHVTSLRAFQKSVYIANHNNLHSAAVGDRTNC